MDLRRLTHAAGRLIGAGIVAALITASCNTAASPGGGQSLAAGDDGAALAVASTGDDQGLDPLAGAATAQGADVAQVADVAQSAVVPAAYSVGHLTLALVKLTGDFANPLFVANAGDGTDRLFVVEQAGKIKIIQGGVVLAAPFLDIRARASCCGERGLLGLAFSPSYKTNGKFYVDYTDNSGNTVIAEFRRSAGNANVANTTARILLRINQPYSNHNGGMIAFGPDGMLYIGMGDGGSGGDPGNRAQNRKNVLGKILRIDVRKRTGKLAYGIPSTNPYVKKVGDDRVWAYGLRNPWRFSFDKATGDLWIGDVGQDRYEEIDRATKASGGGRGANFGWHVMEGRSCYTPASGCNRASKRLPIAVYSHSLGCAVVGGYVYRGSAYPALAGAYLFSDNCSGRIWALTANGASSQTPQELLNTGMAISSFGQGEDGTLYVTDLVGGSVYQVTGATK